ncbi:hypothetical protein ACVNPS_06000 [Candidatus Bipolaricaulota sp. J31]
MLDLTGGRKMSGKEAVELVKAWEKLICRQPKIHAVFSKSMEDVLDRSIPISLKFGPLRIEAWFDADTGRVQAVGRGLEAVAVWRSDGFFYLHEGRWRKSPRAPITVAQLKRIFFGLEAIEAMTDFFMRKGDLAGQAVWIIEGKTSTGDSTRKMIWWITQHDRVLRRLEDTGWTEFTWKGKTSKILQPTVKIEFQKVEFPPSLPRGLLDVPDAIPAVESEKDIGEEDIVKWLESLTSNSRP